MVFQRKVSVAITRYHASRDSNPHMWKISCGLSLSIDEQTTSLFNVAHSLSPSLVAALAADFNALNPPPLGGAPRQLVATGEKIFQDGLPNQDIAACAACHGPDAAGAGLFPRLAGQLYPYVIDKLVNWGKERGQNPKIPDTSAIMSPVAHSLNKSQIEAVAAYVSTLK